MRLEDIKIHQTVKLNIEAMRPIELKGVLHRRGDIYKVLGLQGTCVRLSRVTDRAKIILTSDMIELA